MEVVIIKYNAGNVRSVSFALERAGISAVISDEADIISKADKIIFPGVGEAQTAMNYLKEKKLDEVIRSLKQPVLGICLGMQLLCRYSEEGNTQCIGVIPENVKKFKVPVNAGQRNEFKIPQIGWNKVYELKSPLFDNISEQEYMYFVHGYYLEKCRYTLATTGYTEEYSSAICKNNFYAVQFHPEKSGKAGQQIIDNFLKL